MPRKPPIVILTIIFSALILLIAAVGMYNAVHTWPLLERGEISLLAYLWHLVRAAGVLLLCALTLYAGFRRPSWGHAMTMAFGAFLLVLAVMAVVDPNPHPWFPPQGPDQEAGARFGRGFMIVAMAVYLWRLALGRNARRYYGRTHASAEA